MKTNLYIAFLVLTISCGQASKTKKEAKQDPQGTVEIIETVVDSLPKSVHPDFNEVLAQTKTKSLPQLEVTNFDSFMEEGDYDEVAVQLFKLESIYPNFYKEGYNYRAIAKYKLELSNDFYSIVITVQKGDNEMESVLINYDKEGNIIDHQVVAYDEIAEGMSQIVSRISKNTLTVHHIFWSEIKQIEQVTHTIDYDGKIEKVNTQKLNETIGEYVLVNSTLMDLKLDWIQLKTDLIVVNEQPNDPDESILVLPQIVDEDEQYFELSSRIVLVNNVSGEITHTYFEPKAKDWISDAIRLDEVSIDAEPYQVSEDTGAFGVRVKYIGDSRVNPFHNETLSLFMKSGDSLKKILNNYDVKGYGGEWDGDCDGEFTKEEKRLMVSQEKTNGYFDISVTTEITYSESLKDNKGECLITEKDETKSTVLKFNGHAYTENDVGAISYTEYHPQKLENIQIDGFSIENAHQLGMVKIVTGHFESQDGQMIPQDTETDWGDRLLLINPKGEIVYRSDGMGDPYLFEPNFYRNNTSDKIIIICQLAFEYPFGGEAFILEEGKIKHIGTLDIEGYGEQKYLTDIVEILENNNRLEFTFKSDTLVLEPGSKDIVIKNDNVRYSYEAYRLILKRGYEQY